MPEGVNVVALVCLTKQRREVGRCFYFIVVGEIPYGGGSFSDIRVVVQRGIGLFYRSTFWPESDELGIA